MCLLTHHRIFSGISVSFPSLFGPLPLSPWISLHVLVFFCDFYFSPPTTLKHYLFSFINLFLECISSASSVCIQAWDIFLDFLAEITACCANSTVAKKGERWYRKKNWKFKTFHTWTAVFSMFVTVKWAVHLNESKCCVASVS